MKALKKVWNKYPVEVIVFGGWFAFVILFMLILFVAFYISLGAVK